MTKYQQVAAALHALPAARREEIAEIIDTLFHGDLHPEALSHADHAERVEELRAALVAGEESGEARAVDREAFLARLRADHG